MDRQTAGTVGGAAVGGVVGNAGVRRPAGHAWAARPPARYIGNQVAKPLSTPKRLAL